MRRWIALAARLYPREWRDKYGEEFDALLEDVRPGWRQCADVFCGAIRMQLARGAVYVKLAGALGLAGTMAALTAAYWQTPHYVSSAVVRLVAHFDEQQVGRESVQMHLANQLDEVKRDILARRYLAELILRPTVQLYPQERRRLPMEDVIAQMRQDIHLGTVQPGNGAAISLSISFDCPDPQKARAVVRELIHQSLEANLTRARRRGEAWEMLWKQPIPFGSNLEIVQVPSLPVRAEGAGRLAYVAWGLGGGLVAGVLAAAAWRRPRRALQTAGLAAAGGALGLGVSFIRPVRYQSQSLLRITPAMAPDRYAGPRPDELLAEDRARVLDPVRLETIIQTPSLDLYPRERAAKPIAQVVERMRRDLSLQPEGERLRIAFSYPDRQKAVLTLRALVSLMLEQHNDAAELRASGSGYTSERMFQHKAGSNLEILEPPSLPSEPEPSGRRQFAGAGVTAGLLIGVLRKQASRVRLRRA